jgi:hypothetical protein
VAVAGQWRPQRLRTEKVALYMRKEETGYACVVGVAVGRTNNIGRIVTRWSSLVLGVKVGVGGMAVQMVVLMAAAASARMAYPEDMVR